MAISMRKAVNEKCKQCTYDPLAGLGTWRQQTEGCTVKSCALWEIRPKSKPSKNEATTPLPEGHPLRKYRESLTN